MVALSPPAEADLAAWARNIPDMGAHRLADLFRTSASRVAAGDAIVEVGAWLGASTAHLAVGVREGGRAVVDRRLGPTVEFDKSAALPQQPCPGERSRGWPAA